MNVVPYQATIFVGLKERNGHLHTIEEAEEICQKYCDEIGLCVTVTPTNFIYTKGREPGCMVGFINYPRFPSNQAEIYQKAEALAELLLIAFKQFRVTIQCSDRVEMILPPSDADWV